MVGGGFKGKNLGALAAGAAIDPAGGGIDGQAGDLAVVGLDEVAAALAQVAEIDPVLV